MMKSMRPARLELSGADGDLILKINYNLDSTPHVVAELESTDGEVIEVNLDPGDSLALYHWLANAIMATTGDAP